VKRYIERLRRAAWSYRQPLTHLPAATGATVSDLFVWRRSSEWQTFFELTDMPGLFASAEGTQAKVMLMFFDAGGQLILEKIVETLPNRRNTLAISEIVDSGHGESGTFCVFHSHTPLSLCASGSHLAERGYVSYRYRNAPLRSYVHGNLDAVARLPDYGLQLLGGRSLWGREYNLQHTLACNSVYELGIVNPTTQTQRIECRTLHTDGKLCISQLVDLAPKGSHLFKVMPEHAQQRIVVRSRLVMARPLVFRIQNQKMDVFHG